jgi:radical SAM superfamily enzyme YgiQ (UPF0313 family)
MCYKNCGFAHRLLSSSQRYGSRRGAPFANAQKRRYASVKTILFVLPALQEVLSQEFRQIKYSLFPPLSLLTLAGLVPEGRYNLMVRDEHVEDVFVEEDVDLVVMTVYVSSARRAYEISDFYRARGAKVFLGGIHPTTMPEEAAQHADSICLGPGESVFLQMLEDFEHGCLKQYYHGHRDRDISKVPLARRDLMNTSKYLIPNTSAVSRGCLYSCDFCYKESFWGKNYYEFRPLADVRRELDTFRHKFVFFLDDNLMGNRREARRLFALLKEYHFVWQAAASIDTAYTPGFLKDAYEAGCRSLFVGFESISKANMERAHKPQNQKYDYAGAVRRFHDAGIMINGSFVFGFDEDDPDVFARTVEFAIRNKIETATFHILTPFPGTRLFARLEEEGRILHRDWSDYDTRHVVFQPRLMTPSELEEGYWWSYEEFYSYGSILRRSVGLPNPLKRLVYNVGWKKMDPLWGFAIDHNLIPHILPLFEFALARGTSPRGCHPEAEFKRLVAGARESREMEGAAGVDGSRTHHG